MIGSAWTPCVRPIIGRELVFLRLRRDDLPQLLHVVDQDVGRLHHLHGERGVDDVGRGQPFVDVARGRADVFGDVGQERDDVVVGGLLDFVDARDLEFGAAFDGGEVFARDPAGFARQDLDLEPDAELVLVRPDLAHRLAAVASNHREPRLADTPSVVNAGGKGPRSQRLSTSRVRHTPPGPIQSWNCKYLILCKGI